MQFRMVHTGTDRNSMLYRVDEQHLDLSLRFRITLIRCEPTTRSDLPAFPVLSPPETANPLTTATYTISSHGNNGSGLLSATLLPASSRIFGMKSSN